MPLVGFNFDKIVIEKLGKVEGKIDIKNDLGIDKVEQEKISLTPSEEVLKFTFRYEIVYEPNIGKISMLGHLLYMDKPNEIGGILKYWKKNKKVPKELIPLLLNAVLSRCSVKALALAQDVNLPPHLSLPRVRLKNT